MELDAPSRQVLGEIARQAVAAAVNGEFYQPSPTSIPVLNERRGCFVTLKTKGRLRGCLGCFISSQPLYETVGQYARYSALEDPRFHGYRLGVSELPDLSIEISALSALQPCGDPHAIRLGIDGIYVKNGQRTGCFLPQVAIEQGWSIDEFWGYCCRDKAGLDWDAWRRPETELYFFTAEVFEA